MNKQTKEHVRLILESCEAARNSDAILVTELYKRFYYMQDPVNLSKLVEIMKYCNPYDITRYRQKFNSQGRYLPTSEEVAKQRRLKIADMKESLGYRTGETERDRMAWTHK